MQSLSVQGCSACGQDHADARVNIYPNPDLVPTVEGIKPTGYFICPATGEHVYVNVILEP